MLVALGILAGGASARSPLVTAYWAPGSVQGDRYLPKDLPVGMFQVLYVPLAYPTRTGLCGADPYVEHGKRFTAAQSVDGQADAADPRTLGGVAHQLQLLKRRHTRLKVLVSIAQSDPPNRFARAARSAASRRRFVASCVNRFIRGRYPGIDRHAPRVFDGVDLDWEHPRGPTARHNFTLLAQEFRRQLTSIDRHLLLTAAIAVDPTVPTNYELGWAARSLNWVNLMGYNLAGSWSDVTAFHAPLLRSPNVPTVEPTVAEGVAMFIHHGVPRAKMMLGLPFYGRAYANVEAGGNSGLGRPFDGMLADAPNGALHYHDILARYPALAVHHDTRAAQAWLYDPVGHTTVVFDDPASIARKMAFVRRLELHGAMMWEVSQDTTGHDLLRAMVAGRH